MNAIETTIQLSLDETEAAVRRTLGENGFGILTEIDVAATLKATFGIDRSPSLDDRLGSLISLRVEVPLWPN